ncbi:phage tail tape measure protein [Paenirhodobacter populi]|uniref:Phage tail tape measure protein n=1 Tax=Paenirhodobacter populi TaxID=2306993 RepID=A0A443KIU6_9RHOB|nr:phage tail tape measure protein [Sinirhodobacter populi]RWR10885.1 phage tail tape measure protein [Sinirhodobacter populi]RWR32638.1 phage tail tape measure protein [Sinirhodobacter populi]RWR35099.1 phage tail tape measure protein [Sinirhodobacter populi]
MIEVDGLDTLGRQAAELERNLGGAGESAGAFNDELTRMREGMVYTSREVAQLGDRIGRSLGRAFDDVVFDGMKLSDALKQVSQTMADSAYRIAMRPVEQAAGGAMATGINNLLSGMLPFADGSAFSQGRVVPFASGGVVSAPVAFPMRGATGLMGEAGPEAIMPLTRGADGRLGVQAQGGRSVNVTMNISTPDVAGFARSQSQIAAQVNRALSRGQRNA